MTDHTLITIDDPEIDVDQIVAQIQARICARRAALGEPRQDVPTFGAAAYPGEPVGAHDVDLYYHLRKANQTYTQLEIEPVLAPSTATRVPILGRLWGRARLEAHNLVLFYLGRLAQQQLVVNRHLVGTLNRLAAQLQAQQAELDALRADIEATR